MSKVKLQFIGGLREDVERPRITRHRNEWYCRREWDLPANIGIAATPAEAFDTWRKRFAKHWPACVEKELSKPAQPKTPMPSGLSRQPVYRQQLGRW